MVRNNCTSQIIVQYVYDGKAATDNPHRLFSKLYWTEAYYVLVHLFPYTHKTVIFEAYFLIPTNK